MRFEIIGCGNDVLRVYVPVDKREGSCLYKELEEVPLWIRRSDGALLIDAECWRFFGLKTDEHGKPIVRLIEHCGYSIARW